MSRRNYSFFLTTALVVAGVALAGTACKQIRKPGGASTSASAAASGSAEPTTPCGIYSKQFCEAVGGEQSPTCRSIKQIEEFLPDSACEAGQKDIESTKAKMAEKRKKCDELVTKLCAGVGENTDSCKMVKERTPSFPPDACANMLGRVDQIIADLKKQEDRNKPLDAAKVAAIAASDAPSFGPADSKVTIVLFSDFQCPYCSKAASAAEQIKKEYGTKVRFVFRQFPLSFHKDAGLAAEAALAAHKQGKFWEFHDKVFANQKDIQREGLEKVAAELKLNMAEFKKALDEHTFKAAVEADQKLGESVAVSGTPSMFINGARVQNATAFEAIKGDIEKALGNAPAAAPSAK